jgi:acyl-CoA-binding protein
MPVFFLMILDLTQEAFRRLEAICRVFLWGSNEAGNPKIPLVAWNRLTKPKPQGGLGLVNFQSQSQMMKLRFVTKILQNHNSAWVDIAQQHIREALRHGPYRQQVKLWTCQEYLLLQPSVHLKSAALRSLMKGWKLVLPALKLKVTETHLPHSMTLLQLYYLFLQGSPFDPDKYWELKLYAETRGVFNIQDLLQGNSWQLLQEFADRIRSSRSIGQDTFERLVEFVSDCLGTELFCISNLKGWRWCASAHSFTAWELSLKQWRSL